MKYGRFFIIILGSGVGKCFELYYIEGMEIAEKILAFVLAASLDELNELTVASLARRFGVSKSSLNRHFSREIGTPLGTLILREKMMRAAFILNTELSITIKELSARMGFCTADCFIRIFKQHFGISPNKYREIKATGRNSNRRFVGRLQL